MKLRRANGSPGHEAPLSAPALSCHQDQPDTAHPMRLCAGWLAVVGAYHLGVRTQIISGALPPEITAPQATWPQLHPSLDEMLSHRPTATGPTDPAAPAAAGA